MEEKIILFVIIFFFGVGIWRAQHQREIGLQGLSGIQLSKGQVKHGREWSALYFWEAVSKTKLEFCIRVSKRLMKCWDRLWESWISQCLGKHSP